MRLAERSEPLRRSVRRLLDTCSRTSPRLLSALWTRAKLISRKGRSREFSKSLQFSLINFSESPKSQLTEWGREMRREEEKRQERSNGTDAPKTNPTQNATRSFFVLHREIQNIWPLARPGEPWALCCGDQPEQRGRKRRRPDRFETESQVGKEEKWGKRQFQLHTR